MRVPPGLERLEDQQQSGRLNPRIQPMFQEGIRLMSAGRRAEAIAVYREIVAIDPLRWTAHQNLGGLLASDGQAQAATRYYERAYELSGDGRILNQLGMLRLTQDDTGGFDDLDKSVQYPFDEESSRYNRGLARTFAGRYADALADFDTILKKTPLRPDTLLFRGWTNLMQGQFLDACNDAGRSLEAVKLSKWQPQPARSTTVSNALVIAHFSCANFAPDGRVDQLVREWRTDLRPAEWPDAFVLHVHGALAAEQLPNTVKSFQVPDLEAFLAIESLRRGDAQGAARRFSAARAIAGHNTLARALAERRPRPSAIAGR